MVSPNVHESFERAKGEGFDEVVIDTSRSSLVLKASGGDSSDSHDARRPDVMFAFKCADLARGDEAIHNRH